MSRVTHLAYDKENDKFYLRFSGEPFYSTVNKLKDFGRDRAWFDPEYQWPDGLKKAWRVDPDVLSEMKSHLWNLKERLAKLVNEQNFKQEPLFEEDDAQQAWHEAFQQAHEYAQKAKEEARKREQARREAEEQMRERLRREQERARTSSYTYTPARVSDALKVLGLSGRVTKDDLKVMHRKLMLLHHPDKHVLALPDVRLQHEQECKKINAAHDVVFQWLASHESVYA